MLRMDQTDPDAPGLASVPAAGKGEPDLDGLLRQVARGDQQAFEAVYDQLARPAYGVIRRVLRDPAQSEEVTQEVLLEVWRTASRFDPDRGRAATWVLTIAHRRSPSRTGPWAARSWRVVESAVGHAEVGEVGLVGRAHVGEDVQPVLECSWRSA
jgi:RNA polymerase sigma-70 factor (ECF subfamily)